MPGVDKYGQSYAGNSFTYPDVSKFPVPQFYKQETKKKQPKERIQRFFFNFGNQ